LSQRARNGIGILYREVTNLSPSLPSSSLLTVNVEKKRNRILRIRIPSRLRKPSGRIREHLRDVRIMLPTRREGNLIRISSAECIRSLVISIPIGHNVIKVNDGYDPDSLRIAGAPVFALTRNVEVKVGERHMA
jgi:hypothetical protein